MKSADITPGTIGVVKPFKNGGWNSWDLDTFWKDPGDGTYGLHNVNPVGWVYANDSLAGTKITITSAPIYLRGYEMKIVTFEMHGEHYATHLVRIVQGVAKKP